jgi:uncharacterized protein YjbI with pentapeptide repeats
MKSTARLRIWVLLILIGVALASSLWAMWPWPTGDWKGLALNFGTEMAGAVVTYALLELFIGRRERREAEEKELEAKKANLIAQMGSSVKDVAVAAAEELRRHGWLYDGSLQGANLGGANLQGANLGGANLQEAILSRANLKWIFLVGANLQATYLVEAHLGNANLTFADSQGAYLQEARLMSTKLQNADLTGADLKGAILAGTNLEGAILRQAHLQGVEYNPHTTLPDGTKWTPDTDMARFTDPDHPDFWPPDA